MEDGVHTSLFIGGASGSSRYRLPRQRQQNGIPRLPQTGARSSKPFWECWEAADVAVGAAWAGLVAALAWAELVEHVRLILAAVSLR